MARVRLPDLVSHIRAFAPMAPRFYADGWDVVEGMSDSDIADCVRHISDRPTLRRPYAKEQDHA